MFWLSSTTKELEAFAFCMVKAVVADVVPAPFTPSVELRLEVVFITN
jgi:hypothetical protein